MENKLVLNDGTEIIDGFASKSSRNQLMIRIPGNDITKAAIEFSNSEKTKKIVCYYSIHKTIYEGYINMYSIQYFSDENYVELWLSPVEGEKTSTSQEITVPEEYVPMEVSLKEGEQ